MRLVRQFQTGEDDPKLAGMETLHRRPGHADDRAGRRRHRQARTSSASSARQARRDLGYSPVQITNMEDDDAEERLQVADAARIATGVGAAARPHWGGYVRVLTPPSCSRCAVLAGKYFRWNTGFRRHPKCDCQHFPSSSESYARSEGFITNPDDAWRAGQIKDLTKAQQDALENGADLSQVVNARRGMSTTDVGGRRVRITNEGTSRRGLFGSSAAARRAGFSGTGVPRQQGAAAGYILRRTTLPRLTPEAIYRAAEGDRDTAVRLLRRFGYIT
jgi:hypothetical protein